MTASPFEQIVAAAARRLLARTLDPGPGQAAMVGTAAAATLAVWRELGSPAWGLDEFGWDGDGSAIVTASGVGDTAAVVNALPDRFVCVSLLTRGHPALEWAGEIRDPGLPRGLRRAIRKL